jgi:transposase
VRRLEVFTGAGRRRAWSAEQKGEILAESYEGGEKVSAVARRHGLRPQQLFGWRREAQGRLGRQARDDRGHVSASAFAPIVVQASLDAPLAPSHKGGAAMIEIVIGPACSGLHFRWDCQESCVRGRLHHHA